MEEKLKKIIHSLENQCVRREYCSSDILKKAADKLEGNMEEARQVLAYLVENRFVDDSRYAGAFAREKSSISGWGPVKIRFALAAKRIPESVIKEALEEIEESKADSRMEKLLETKWKSLQQDPQGRLKLIRFALSRGYTYESIKDAVARITSESASDDI